MIYIATPYSSDHDEIMHARFRVVNRFCAHLMNKGLIIYSPITHMHPIALQCELPRGWDFWEKFDREFLSKCDEIYVLCQTGWKTSKGVTAEIKIARELGLTVRFFEPPTWEEIECP